MKADGDFVKQVVTTPVTEIIGGETTGKAAQGFINPQKWCGAMLDNTLAASQSSGGSRMWENSFRSPQTAAQFNAPIGWCGNIGPRQTAKQAGGSYIPTIRGEGPAR
jgi:hypothetical protein